MTDEPKLAGLRIEGFRSFPAGTPQTISPLTKVHLLAGPNNSGKSNILRIARRALPALSRTEQLTLEPSDRPYGQPDASLRLGIAVRRSRDSLRERLRLTDQVDTLLQFLGDAGYRESETGLTWFEFEFETDTGNWQASSGRADRVTTAAEQAGARPQLAGLSNALASQTGGYPHDDAVRVLTQWWVALSC